MLRCASAFSISGRSSLLDAAFHSPAATVNLAIRLRGRVNAPGLSSSMRFRRLRLARSASRSRPRPAFLSPPAARSTHVARCQVQYRNSRSVVGFSLPSRISRSFGIKALNPIPNSEACPCESPDLPSLPVTLEIISYLLCATDHRSRSATSRQARCPSNLLEPCS
jgi:hypothetical protein